MDKYLLELLKELKTIIIPGIGALTVTNEKTGEIMFMSYLKYDDGTLAKHIAEKESWEINDAKNLIAKYVRDVTSTLDKGDEYNMFQFGAFSKVSGEIEFNQWLSGNVSSENTVTEEIEVPKPEENIEKEVVQEIKVDEPIKIEEPIIEEVKIEEVKIEEIIPVVSPLITTNLDDLLGENTPKEIVTPEKEIKIEAPQVIENKVETISEDISEPIEFDIPEKIQPITEVISKEKERIEEKIEEISFDKSEVPAVEVSNEKVIEPIKETITETVQEKKQDKIQEEIQPLISEEASENVNDTAIVVPKKKSKFMKYVFWKLVIFLLGGGTFVALNINELKKDFPFLARFTSNKTIESPKDVDTIVTSSDENIAPEPIPTEEIPQTTEVPVEEAPVETPVALTPTPSKPVKVNDLNASGSFSPMNTSKPFHIIAGSFGSESNAKKLASELKSKGLSSVSIGNTNGTYRVSVEGFSSKNEAQNALSAVQQTVSGAWILKL